MQYKVLTDTPTLMIGKVIGLCLKFHWDVAGLCKQIFITYIIVYTIFLMGCIHVASSVALRYLPSFCKHSTAVEHDCKRTREWKGKSGSAQAGHGRLEEEEQSRAGEGSTTGILTSLLLDHLYSLDLYTCSFRQRVRESPSRKRWERGLRKLREM